MSSLCCVRVCIQKKVARMVQNGYLYLQAHQPATRNPSIRKFIFVEESRGTVKKGGKKQLMFPTPTLSVSRLSLSISVSVSG